MMPGGHDREDVMRRSILFSLVLLASCGGKGKGTDAEMDGDVEEMDAAEQDVEDAEPDDAGEEEASPPTACEVLGLPVRDFDPDGSGYLLYDTASDVTLQTTEGPWTLSEAWSGCDVYLFIQDVPRQCEGWPVALWSRDVATLFARSPRNVRYFFVSYEESYDLVLAALDALRANVDAALAAMSEEDREWWLGRVHYVTDGARTLPMWLGVAMRNPGWGAGVDRFQRIRYIGSYGDPTRPPGGTGWFDPNISMAANEAVYYNFEAEREAALEAEGATLVEIFSGEVISDPGWAGERGYATVTLPGPVEMDGFDTMELDLYLGCEGSGEYGDCPAWDYIASLYLCDETDPDTCTTELGRWITTYHREGRWVHDASGLMPLVASGGERRFAFYTQQPYEVHLSIRFSNQGKGARPVQAIYLFSGGDFDLTYNDDYAPITVAIPADAARVEIATVLSGHGQVDPGNCAEFCNTTHHFFVNGTENVRSFPEVGTSDGCMQQVEQGTVPNQYGTWWYGRSGWCPGKEVPVVMIDVTDQVTPGSDAVLDYEAYYGGSPYPGGAWIDLTSWLVVSK